ncbi:hypothetical protein QYF36_000362 [Acer negundo]|nr:hypothetical protein QYF36_000362 [Acer negundo]
MVDRQPSFLVLKYLWLVLGSVIITASNPKLAEAYEADISGFINIDCGASESYTDNQNGLFYEPDTKYIDTGEIDEIIPNFTDYYRSHRHLRFSLRSFPLGKRNYYTLKPSHDANNNNFIRAVFEYGNYDDNDKIPVFDLYLDNSIYRIPNGALSYYLRYDIGGDNVSSDEELRIELNGERNLTEPVILDYLKPVTINTIFPPINSNRVHFSIYAADDSNLPPILNAVEIYEIIELQYSPTNLDDECIALWLWGFFLVWGVFFVVPGLVVSWYGLCCGQCGSVPGLFFLLCFFSSLVSVLCCFVPSGFGLGLSPLLLLLALLE